MTSFSNLKTAIKEKTGKVKHLVLSLKKEDWIMVGIFLSGFFSGVLDRQTYSYAFKKVIFLPNMAFWAVYIGFYSIFMATILLFPKVIKAYRIDGSLSRKKIAVNAIAIAMYSFFIGELVNLTNALIVVLFERMAWLSG